MIIRSTFSIYLAGKQGFMIQVRKSRQNEGLIQWDGRTLNHFRLIYWLARLSIYFGGETACVFLGNNCANSKLWNSLKDLLCKIHKGWQVCENNLTSIIFCLQIAALDHIQSVQNQPLCSNCPNSWWHSAICKSRWQVLWTHVSDIVHSHIALATLSNLCITLVQDCSGPLLGWSCRNCGDSSWKRSTLYTTLLGRAILSNGFFYLAVYLIYRYNNMD